MSANILNLSFEPYMDASVQAIYVAWGSPTVNGNTRSISFTMFGLHVTLFAPNLAALRELWIAVRDDIIQGGPEALWSSGGPILIFDEGSAMPNATIDYRHYIVNPMQIR